MTMTTTMPRAARRLAFVTAFTALSVAVGLPAAAARADQGDNAKFPARLNLPNGIAPEGITTGRGTTIYAGSLANGAIYRVNARGGAPTLVVPGIAGRVAVGLDFEKRGNRLWVAGGPTGAVTVYDARTGAELARYTIPGSGFLNDLVVTRNAVYVTDSNVQRLVVIPLGRRGALPAAGEVRTLPLTGDIAYTTGFNANGIDAARGGRTLVIVQSNTSTLFNVDALTGVTRRITLTGGTLSGGDGIELRGRKLYVVRGAPNAVVKIALNGALTEGRIVATLTDPGLAVPTTATFVNGRLYAVNARFGTPPGPTVEYWITRLPRK